MENVDLDKMQQAKTLGILAHSFEGGALCFLTACREGSRKLGPHLHPTIVLSAIPMGLSMPGWESDQHESVGEHLAEGVCQLERAGADFYICPDNTAHIVLEQIADQLPLPGLHIAEVVCHEISMRGWKTVGLIGTNWTMTGPVYKAALANSGLEKRIPNELTRKRIDDAIFQELCQGIFRQDTTQLLIDSIVELKTQGAECVILGCTEIPLVVTSENSVLPILDSTRLLAKYSIESALNDTSNVENGWLKITKPSSELNA